MIYFKIQKIVDPKTGEVKQIVVSVDDGIRPNTNVNDLAKLKPAFKKDGSTTAGTQEICFFVNLVTLGKLLSNQTFVNFFHSF